MRIRSVVYILIIGIAAILIGVVSSSRRTNMPLTLEFVGLTNVPPTVAGLPLWSARDGQGVVSGLLPASPSHVLFSVRNRTRRYLPFRPLLYQFADSLPAGAVVPRGPSRHRGSRSGALATFPPELDGYNGMAFGPPDRDCFTSRLLAPREAGFIVIPRPPFDCVWRAAIGYELPLTRPEKLRHLIKARLHIHEMRNIIDSPQGLAYDEWIYGAWITNAVLNTNDGPANGSQQIRSK